jgi:hypothetical protein
LLDLLLLSTLLLLNVLLLLFLPVLLLIGCWPTLLRVRFLLLGLGFLIFFILVVLLRVSRNTDAEEQQQSGHADGPNSFHDVRLQE